MPVIILTAGGLAGDEADALAAGASAFLSKPFSQRALLDLIASLIGSGRGGADPTCARCANTMRGIARRSRARPLREWAIERPTGHG